MVNQVLLLKLTNPRQPCLFRASRADRLGVLSECQENRSLRMCKLRLDPRVRRVDVRSHSFAVLWEFRLWNTFFGDAFGKLDIPYSKDKDGALKRVHLLSNPSMFRYYLCILSYIQISTSFLCFHYYHDYQNILFFCFHAYL